MREWESDPLFAAAEVVQDSADRMESIYRLLLHEQSVVQGDHMDENVLTSIEYHRRDLATTLETAKWQLEDFEREVNVSAIAHKSPMKQSLITRHMQFIKAIREQISLVEQNMNTSLGNSLRNMNLNEQDRDGLALFLLGEKPVKHISDQELEDNGTLRWFLDPAVSSSSAEDISEQKAGETGANYGRYNEEGNWVLEANEAKAKTYLQKNKLRDYSGRMNLFGSLGNFLSNNESRASRSFTKRLKDGEERRQSPLYSDAHHGMQRYLAQLRSAIASCNFYLPCSQLSAQAMQSGNSIRDHREKCQRFLHCIHVRNRPTLSILVLLLTLLILSMWVS